jgi:hypothetical protein
MDQIREYLKRPLVIGILAFVVGVIIGLVVLGWWLWPVQWTNASPSDLHPGYQEMWLRMAIISYGATGDAASAKIEYEALGNAGADILGRIQANPGNIQASLITQFSAAVSAVPQVPPTTQPGITATPTTATAGKSNLTTLLGVMCVVTLLVAAAIVAYFVFQGRKRPGGVISTPQITPAEGEPPAEWTSLPTSADQAPMAQFMASYKAGDDLFDDSFSIDSPSGEFLGECGVGISETIGVGVPKKVTAFEVWLFDKNDIQTVTKVLMSAHAFNDPTIRHKLEAKGEPFEANSGGQTVLETATLKLVARVVDMAYGQGSLPENSFFDSLVLELAIWQKQ